MRLSRARCMGAIEDLWRCHRPRCGRSPHGDRSRQSFLAAPAFLAASALLTIPLLALSTGPALHAQEESRPVRGTSTLLGVVLSAEDERPLDDARVRLLGLGVDEASGGKGHFKFARLPAGVHQVTAEYLGFKSDTVEVLLANGATTYVSLLLETDPVELPDLRVGVERVIRNPMLAGYYERRDRGLGKFISHEDLQRRDLISNLRMIPGVAIQECLASAPSRTVQSRGELEVPTGDGGTAGISVPSGGGGMRLPGCWEVKIGRGFGSSGYNSRCVPEVWIDGHLISTSLPDPVAGNPMTILQNFPRDLIEGIEVYRSAALAPAQYRTFGACGIMLVWTVGRSR